MDLNSIRISTVRGHAPYKYPPRNTMPKSLGADSNPLRISWSDTSFSPTVQTSGATWLIYMWDVTHDSFLCETWPMTHSYVRRVLYIGHVRRVTHEPLDKTTETELIWHPPLHEPMSPPGLLPHVLGSEPATSLDSYATWLMRPWEDSWTQVLRRIIFARSVD